MVGRIEPLVCGMLDSWRSSGQWDKWVEEKLGLIEKYPWGEWEWEPNGGMRELPKNTAVVSILGMSGAGKSSFVRSLGWNDRDKGFRALKVPEFGGADKGPGGIRVEDPLLLERVKLFAFEQWLGVFLETARNRPTEKIVMVAERGPNDVLAYLFWHMEVARREGRITPEFQRDWISTFAQALAATVWVDGTILYDVTKKTTRFRRRSRGKNPEGPVVNSENREVFVRAYGRWLGLAYLLAIHQGMSILTINGGKDIERNRARATNFCGRLVGAV